MHTPISTAVFVGVFACMAGLMPPGPAFAQSTEPAAATSSAKSDAKTLSDLRRQLFETKGSDAAVVTEIQRFADAGNPTAHFLMGEVYRLGLGVAADPLRAVESFRASLSGAVPGSAERLGMLQKVEGSPAFDPQDSTAHYQMAAAEGSQTARLALADAYAQGFGVSPDLAMAERLYAELMVEGEARAAVRLGALRLEGGNPAGAADAWKIAAAAGRNEVLMRLGVLLRDQLNDGPGARDVFLAAQSAGIARATAALLQGDLDGAFGPASDTAGAAKWLETEADLRSTIRLARALRDGSAVAVPPLSIVRALIRHDAEGAPAAASMLLQFYTRGTVDQNAPALAELNQTMQRRLTTANADALRSLSLAALRRQDFDFAVEAMQAAATAGDVLALPQLALWHFRGQLGPQSDPAMGITFLKQAEPLQDPAAAQLIAGALGDANVRAAVDIPGLLSVLERAAKDGDAMSAALYLRVLRLGGMGDTTRLSEAFVGQLPQAARSQQTELEYLLLRAGTAHSERSWKEIATRGLDLPDAEFARLLSGIRGTNPNVLTYTLQSRLAKEGYDVPQNGFLTPATVRTILVFCKANEILPDCLEGPLRASAIRAISQVFAARPSP